MSSFRIGLIQLAVSSNKAANLSRATEKIREASQNGAKLVSLPECFNSPYGTNYFPEYAESIPDGQSCQILSKAAKENSIYLIGQISHQHLFTKTAVFWRAIVILFIAILRFRDDLLIFHQYVFVEFFQFDPVWSSFAHLG